MNRRPALTVGLATALVAVIAASVAIAGPTVVGKDGNTQSIDVKLAPKKLSKTKLTPAALSVTTKTTSTTAPNGVPSPAVRAVLDFDKNASIFTKGLPTCDPAKVQNTSTEVALRECGRAKIGSGTASALLPVGTQVFPVNQTATIFNGVPKGGKPVVVVHTYGTTPIQTTLVLAGAVSKYNKEGYGPRIDLEVPLLAGGAGALTGIQVKVDKKYTFKGEKRSFISAKCTSGKLKARGVFTFKDGESLTALSTQSCKKGK